MRILFTKQSSIEEISRRLRSVQRREGQIERNVRAIIGQVRRGGDRALFELARRFDGVMLGSLVVTRDEIKEAYAHANDRLARALRRSKRNIERFHSRQVRKRERSVETEPGIRVWREFRPIERVGLYIPGGKAPYCSTVLMLGVPARIAGCQEVVMCTPPSRDGRCHPGVLVAADLCGIERIYKIGGAQAIAAMAFGTETVPRVHKIFGPGNRHVTTAKLLVYGAVDIDMPAGPSELLVIADEVAEPRWIAADLLSQLEHGEDSQGVLLTPSKDLAERVIREMKKQIKGASHEEIMEKSLRRSFAIVVDSLGEACRMANEYAPEHLEIVTRDEAGILRQITNAGSIFLGRYTPEPLGDYASGANHTLPTSGYSRMFSALSTDSFGKMIQIQKASRRGLIRLQETVETMARTEGFEAHQRAIAIRFES